LTTCYRHPDRESGVSCQRCERYICPECSTPGAVGFLCPEDAQQRVDVRVPRFQQSVSQRAPITLTLIGINVFVFLLQVAFASVTEMLAYMRIGSEYEYGSLLRAFTSAFAHSPTQYTHILFNMYSLFVLGTLLEPLLGKLKFTVLYMLSAFGGSIGFLFFGSFGSYVVGASGAIFGLMGAYLIYLRALRLDARQMLVIVAINVVVSFLPGIAWQAHFGGMAAGILVAYVFTKLSNPTQKTILWSTISAITAALFLIWFVGDSMLPSLY